MDLYPDLAVQGGILSSTALSTRLLTAISRFALKKADIVIVLGRCMQEYLHKEGVPHQRIHVIPNWTNAGVYPVPHSDNQLCRELGLKDQFVVLYSGNIGVSHFFDDLLEVARRVRNVGDLRFVFIGDGVRRDEIEQAKETHHLNNVLLLPFQPVERLAHSLSMGDVHFISLRPGFEGLVVPSKTYSALAAGRAVIYQGSPHGEIAHMIAEEQIGSVVPLHDPDTLERMILYYYQNPAIVADQGEKAYELSQGRFSRKHSLERYGALLIGPLADTTNQV
jgi:glycosyltransferase involved in cell wall biosynthesis